MNKTCFQNLKEVFCIRFLVVKSQLLSHRFGRVTMNIKEGLGLAG